MSSYKSAAKIVIVLILLGGCAPEDKPTASIDQEAELVLNSQSPDPAQQPDQAKDEFVPAYTSASVLNDQFMTDSPPFIFDVRSFTSYQQSHIKTALSMPYGKTDDALLAQVASLTRDSEIVTYCGCPRHLSSLAAKDLTNRGYNNVSVLYEGFWHWKEKQYPTVYETSTAQPTSRLMFEGVMVENQLPAAGVDVFLKHTDSGQLEAARTDYQGRFGLEFHLYGFQPGDQFDVIVADLDNTPSTRISALEGELNFLKVSL